MPNKYSVKLKTIVEEMGLTPLHTSSDYEKVRLTTTDVNRPAMQLTGFYSYFDPERLQVLGRVESTYLDTLSAEERKKSFEDFMQYDIPAIVLCHNIPAMPECIEMAEKYDKNLFITEQDTSDFQANVIVSLQRHLAPRVQLHGVLVDINGEGVLLTGESSIGKSETALELVKRGHRLVADDAVEIKRLGDRLVGTAPEMIRYYMELRGIGIINVREIYGVGSVKPRTDIDIVVKMERWEEGRVYERFGLDEAYEDILGVQLPKVTIPVSPGRNLAILMELAAMNNRQKKMGFNAAATLATQHDKAINEGGF